MDWINLGIQQLVLGEWVSFNPSVNGETFRFTPANLGAGNGAGFKTYALVRFAFLDGDTTTYTPSKRIYPRPEPTVIDFPIPAEIKNSGGLVWYPQAMKQIYYRWRGRSQEPAWTLQVEDKISEGRTPEEQLQALDDISKFLY